MKIDAADTWPAPRYPLLPANGSAISDELLRQSIGTRYDTGDHFD